VSTDLDSRDVSLTIPAKPDYLVLARLALAAVCRLTPLSPEDVADLKLAVTEAAADFVDERAADDEEARVDFSFRLEETRLVLLLEGSQAEIPAGEQELGRAIIDATVDECDFAPGRTRLVKRLVPAG
jgi:serine/threonine-protein kinase RsbW